MKFLSTIREFTTLIFNKSNGNDIELRPETTTGDSTANQEIVIPDLGDSPTSGSPTSDTMVLEAHAQTLSNKDFASSVGTDRKVALDIDGATDSTTTTLDFNQTANRTITFPDQTDTLATTSDLTTSAATKVSKAGDTMTGNLNLSGANIVMVGAETVDGRDVSADGAQLDTNTGNISANTSDIADIRTTTGTADGDTSMGIFTGTTISDNVSTKTALQELETAHESHTGSSSAHGISGDVVGTTDLQTLTNKTLSNITGTSADRLPLINSSGQLVTGSVTDTEATYLSGVGAPLQGQIDGKQADVITTEGDLVIGNSSGEESRLELGSAGQVLTVSGSTAIWSSPAGTGDVTAASNFIADNRLIRSDGTGKGIKDSGVTLDGSDNITGVVGLTASGTVQGGTLTDGSLTVNGGDISSVDWVTYNTTLTTNQTFTSGTSSFHPEPTIDTGVTVTVNSGAKLLTGTINVNGTLTINGTHKVI